MEGLLQVELSATEAKERIVAIIFLDECGHTGQNLLDKQQPFFVLASHNFTEEQCAEYKRALFTGVKARSLKHASLAKVGAQQHMVVNLLQELTLHQESFKVTVTHKRYALVGKIVDLIIEPFAYETGFDLYDKGANIATTNLFYHTMPALGGEAFFNELLVRFQTMLRVKTPESFNRFFELVFQPQLSEDLEEELDMLRMAHNVLGLQLIETLPDNSLDVAFSLAMGQMAAWRNQLAELITLIHDASTNMSKQKEIWNALMSPDVPPAFVGYDRRTMSFPIGVSETRFEKDETWVGLQIADIIAGAFARAARWQHLGQDPRDIYGRALMEVIADITIIPLLPGTEMTPDELGTVGENAADPNLHIAKIIHDVKMKSE